MWLTSKGDTAIEYKDQKTFRLWCFSPSAASRVTQLLQLFKNPLGDKKPSDALLEMKALAMLPPAADGSVRKLDLLRALWLFCLQESVGTVLPNAKEMDDDELWQMTDNLNDAQSAAAHHTYAMSPATLVPQQKEEDIAVLSNTPSRIRQHPGSQHYKPKVRPRQQYNGENFSNSLCYFHARYGPNVRNCKPGCL